MAGKKPKPHEPRAVHRYGDWPLCLHCGGWLEYIKETREWKHV